MQKYTKFDHTADLGIEINGRTKKELFTNAAWALNDILLDSREKKSGRGTQKTIKVEGSDISDLLINFFRELLYQFNGKRNIVGRCEIIACNNERLTASLLLQPFDNKVHAVKTEIKAITYHGLSVVKCKSGWKARVIFDV